MKSHDTPYATGGHALQRGLEHSPAELFDRMRTPSVYPGRIFDTSGAQMTCQGVQKKRDRLAERGIGYRDRVLVNAGSGVLSMEWFVAVWSLGAVLIPIDANASSQTLASIVDDSGARAHCDPAADLVRYLPCSSSANLRIVLERAARVTGVDLAMIIYSSGSTGLPKGIMLTHTNVLSALRAISNYLEVRTDDVILAIPPLQFDYVLYQALFALHAGCTTIVSVGAFSPAALVAAMERYQPTIVPVVPAIGQMVAKTLLTFKKPANSVRLVTNTGGHLPIGTIAELRRAFPSAGVMPMYGLTESKRCLFLPPHEADGRPGSVGKPMPGLDARVFVETQLPDGSTGLREARAGQVGLLCVRGSSVMQGYVSDASGGGARASSRATTETTTGLAPATYSTPTRMGTSTSTAARKTSSNRPGTACIRARSKNALSSSTAWPQRWW